MSSPIFRGAPGRGSSARPSSRRSAKRLRHRQAGDVEPVGNGNVAQTLRREQNNLRPHRVRLGGLPAARPRLQFVPLRLVQVNPNRSSPGQTNLPNLSPGKVNHDTKMRVSRHNDAFYVNCLQSLRRRLLVVISNFRCRFCYHFKILKRVFSEIYLTKDCSCQHTRDLVKKHHYVVKPS